MDKRRVKKALNSRFPAFSHCKKCKIRHHFSTHEHKIVLINFYV
jgi:hypothetical protein